MPIYEYRCKECEEVFSQLRMVSNSDSDIKCVKCGADEVERIISSFSTNASSSCTPAGSGFS